jgi:ketosteroid isomerase-like protein
MTQKMSAPDALKHSFETGDRGPWEALFAPGCINWHNSDKLEVSAADFAGGGMFQKMVDGIDVEIVRHATFDGGELIQIAIRGTVHASGNPFDAHNCIVIATNEQGITRIEDYVDPTFGDQITAGAS